MLMWRKLGKNNLSTWAARELEREKKNTLLLFIFWTKSLSSALISVPRSINYFSLLEHTHTVSKRVQILCLNIYCVMLHVTRARYEQPCGWMCNVAQMTCKFSKNSMIWRATSTSFLPLPFCLSRCNEDVATVGRLKRIGPPLAGEFSITWR